MSTPRRLANFELLRITSMMMIIMLHLLGNEHGNVLSKTIPFSYEWILTWSIEAFCVIAVNCYVLISGYFLIGDKESIDFDSLGKPRKAPLKRILNLCVIVWSYNLFFYIIGYLMGWVEISKASILHLFTPITGRTYWFISVYIGLYLISPYLNVLIKKISQNSLQRLIRLLLIMLSLISTLFPIYDTFSTGGGSGIAWFIVLYVIAAYIRLYGFGKLENWTVSKWIVAYIIVTTLIITSKIVISVISIKIFGHTIGTSILYQYSSPTVLMSSLCFFMAFKSMKINERFCNIILNISPMMFGVYVIHENPVLSKKMWGVISPDIGSNAVLLLLKLLVIVVIIMACCMLIEACRISLFRVIMKHSEQTYRDGNTVH